MVPKLLIKVSPGPETRKKASANHHIVGSFRKRLVSEFRSQVFLCASASRRALVCESSEAVLLSIAFWEATVP